MCCRSAAVLLLLLCLPVLFSCVSDPAETRENGPQASAEKTDVPSGENSDRALGDSILRSIQAGSYPEFASVLAGRSGFNIPADDFHASCSGVKEKYGEIVSWSYLTGLKSMLVRNSVWKVRFLKTRSDGRKEEQEMLFRLVTGEPEGKTKVLALGFF